MRRSLVGLLIVLTACSGAELAPTTSTSIRPTTSSSSVATTGSPPTTTSTTVPATTTTTPAPLQSLAYDEVASLDFPIQVVPWNVFDLVATKDGRVWLLENGEISETPVLDISDQVRDEGEQGFLSLAVDPNDYERLFVHYSDRSGNTVVSWFGWGDGRWAGEHVVLQVDQPAANHNGGELQFGPDGALYLGLGDGGGGGDTYGNGQNTGTLLGGLVRIDVDDPGAKAELFQYGLRNPWRFWIDGDLIYIADVGQGSYEEVDVAPLARGTNYGWPITEGLHCFQPSSGCDTTGITLPVIEVAHGDAGTCSITGGLVYQGNEIPEIAGDYFYSDYCGGYLRSFRYQGGQVSDETDWTDQVGVPGRVVSFGTDNEGEMYVLTTDRVLRLSAAR